MPSALLDQTMHFVEERREALDLVDDDSFRLQRREARLESVGMGEQLGVEAEVQEIEGDRVGEGVSQEGRFSRSARSEQEEALVPWETSISGKHAAIFT